MGGLDHPDLQLELELEPYAPLRARHAVSVLGNPSPDLRDTVVLLVSELVTNSVRHAEEGRITLRAWMPRDLVRVEIEDASRGLDPDAEGFGLRLVRELTDRWDVENPGGATRVWFEIDRH